MTTSCQTFYIQIQNILVLFLRTMQRRLRTEVFLRETIPWWLAPLGYGGLAILSIIFIPMVYRPVKWYYVAVAYVITPLFALPNSYGCGLTDWDCSSMYAKLALFIFAAWAGVEVTTMLRLIMRQQRSVFSEHRCTARFEQSAAGWSSHTFQYVSARKSSRLSRQYDMLAMERSTLMASQGAADP
eukprot:GHUV01046796.1.p1 GENE.GHUV01046796.1~~GHUV01046796.1.p1  ORF type:complete len:185 (-),score=2.07 GHUV01046796.1:1-555(-)